VIAVCMNEQHSHESIYFTLQFISGCNIAILPQHTTLLQTVQCSQMISLTLHQVFIVCSNATYHLPLFGVSGCAVKVRFFHLPHSRSSTLCKKASRHLFHFKVSDRAVKARLYHLPPLQILITYRNIHALLSAIMRPV
jgi:hypothetical protein